MSRVNEWASPNFHEPFGRMLECLAAILFLGALVSGRKKHAGEYLVVLLLLSQTLYAGRNAPIFAMVATVIWAGDVQFGLQSLINMSHRERGSGESLFGKSPPILACLAIMVIMILFAVARVERMAQPGATGLGLESIARTSFLLKSCPEKACQFVVDERFPTTCHLYNAYGDGGYLIWRLSQYPVFIDGRADVYFGRVLDDYARLNKLPFNWHDTIDRDGIDVALLTTREMQARLFLSAPDWALVYVDRPQLDESPDDDVPANALIFVRRTPANRDLIIRCRQDCAALRVSPEIWAHYASYPALH